MSSGGPQASLGAQNTSSGSSTTIGLSSPVVGLAQYRPGPPPTSMPPWYRKPSELQSPWMPNVGTPPSRVSGCGWFDHPWGANVPSIDSPALLPVSEVGFRIPSSPGPKSNRGGASGKVQLTWWQSDTWHSDGSDGFRSPA